jgi:hypothetical protein
MFPASIASYIDTLSKLFGLALFGFDLHGLIGDSRLFVVADDAFDRTSFENRAFKAAYRQGYWTYNHDTPPLLTIERTLKFSMCKIEQLAGKSRLHRQQTENQIKECKNNPPKTIYTILVMISLTLQ